MNIYIYIVLQVTSCCRCVAASSLSGRPVAAAGMLPWARGLAVLYTTRRAAWMPSLGLRELLLAALHHSQNRKIDLKMGKAPYERIVLRTGRRWQRLSGGGPSAADEPTPHLAPRCTARRAGSPRRKPWLAAAEYLKLSSHEARDN